MLLALYVVKKIFVKEVKFGIKNQNAFKKRSSQKPPFNTYLWKLFVFNFFYNNFFTTILLLKQVYVFEISVKYVILYVPNLT